MTLGRMPFAGVLRNPCFLTASKSSLSFWVRRCPIPTVFFCHSRGPWKRGTCESQSGRIRHYLPKGTDLSLVSYQQRATYQEILNERPRKILGWKSCKIPFTMFKKIY